MNTKYLSKDEIYKELDDYLFDCKINYAILFNGTWGSGKTHFLKEYQDHINQKIENSNEANIKKIIYISLYGISTIAELKQKMQLLLIKNDKIRKVIPLVSAGVDALTSKMGFENASEIIDSYYEINSVVIIFDDLERCNLDINTILGYINELVEHNDCKAIIVADESKIGLSDFNKNLELKYLVSLSKNLQLEGNSGKTNRIDNYYDVKTNRDNSDNNKLTRQDLINKSKTLFQEDNIYKEIKEKLIGKTIYFKPDISSIYDVFLEELIKNKKAKETAKKYKESFLKILQDNFYFNLRTIQFAFETFDRLVKETINLIDFEKCEKTYLKDLFIYCTISSISTKQGNFTYNWQPLQEFGFLYFGDGIYSRINNNCMGFKFVDDYLKNSLIRNSSDLKDILNQYIKKIKVENKNQDDPLYKLDKYWVIPEDELTELLDELIANIYNNKYNLESYSKIVSVLSHIEEMEVCTSKISCAINELEKNIENNIVQGSFNEDRIFDGSANVSKIYNKNMIIIRELASKKALEDENTTINHIFNDTDWGFKLNDFCKENDGKFSINKRFAYLLDIGKICDNIKEKSIENIYQFWYALQNTYNYANVRDIYQNDKEKLTELTKALNHIDNIDGVKKYAINLITNFLNNVIEKL